MEPFSSTSLAVLPISVSILPQTSLISKGHHVRHPTLTSAIEELLQAQDFGFVQDALTLVQFLVV